MAAIAAVDDHHFGLALGQDFHLLKRGIQRVAAIRIVREAAHADDKPLVERRGDADLAAEFIANSGLALGEALMM